MAGNKLGHFILAAGIMLAMACSSDDGGDKSGGDLSSSSGSGSSSPGSHFNPNIQYIDFTDSRNNKTYKSVVIDGKTWMAENLNYAVGGKCYGEDGQAYDDDVEDYVTLSFSEIQANCVTYGRLYNLETARLVCPTDWHLPSEAEWTALTDYVGSNAGTKLKSATGWSSGNGTDNHGFSALPSGFGNSDGYFEGVGIVGYWWSSTTENDSGLAWSWVMDYEYSDVGKRNYDKSRLFSVRCVKDE